MVDKVRKHFVRLVCEKEISRDDIVDFFDIVQSVVPTKVFQSFDGNGNKVKAEVVHYESDGVEVYEVLTEEDISQAEGTQIAEILAEVLVSLSVKVIFGTSSVMVILLLAIVLEAVIAPVTLIPDEVVLNFSLSV